ncbi:MAG: phosphoribosyltransferase [Burkholderiaceae bacterium]|nr:phosphoribosyltransferase [Burkholderiaceae bacterium]
MEFADRIDAAERLAEALAGYGSSQPVIFAIPRGAVPMGSVLAKRLHGALDVVLVSKLRAPNWPELAIGAIDENGWTYLAPRAKEDYASAAYIAEHKQQQLALLAQRRQSYTPGRQPEDLAGRVAIVVDDGLATGSTMLAALHAVRARQPRRLVCAVPVAHPDALETVAPYADEVVCLYAPISFAAVGGYYRDFTQIEDHEVRRLLNTRSQATKETPPIR